jgi:adenylate cyclase
MANREIEKKFLVRSMDFRTANPTRMRQGYLSTEPERTVRVRLDGERGVLTIKGRSRGAVRAEYEYEIPASDANELLGMTLPSLVEKLRHRVEHGGFVWEVDEFLGENAGLVVAELEVQDESDFGRALEAPPAWLGREVTDDSRFANARLAEKPFSSWSEADRKLA